MKILPLLVLCALVAPCAAEPVEVLWKSSGLASREFSSISAIGLDQAGNVGYLDHNSSYFYGALRVGKVASEDGHLLWATKHGGTLKAPSEFAAVVDPKGDIIVSATYPTFSDGYLSPTVITRYAAADGEVRWQRVNFGETAHEEMVLDGKGGFTTLGLSSSRAAVENHSLDDGSLRWRRNVLLTGSYSFGLYAVPEGAGGVIFITDGFSRFKPFNVVRIDSEGRLLWQRRLEVRVGRPALFPVTAISRKGDVALAFRIQTGVNRRLQYLTKLSAHDGRTLWSTLYKARGTNSRTEPRSVVLNASGDVVVSCSDYSVNPAFSSPVVAFASRNGAAKVLSRRNDVSAGVLAIDDDQSLIVAGQYTLSPPNRTFISKLNREGETLWSTSTPGRNFFFNVLFVGPGYQVCGDNSSLTKFVDGATPQTGSEFATGATYAGLRGAVSSNGFTASGAFEFGRKPDLEDGTTTDFQTIPGNRAAHPIEASLSGLEPNTIYYYRAIARANGRTTRGVIRDFRTRAQ